MALKDILLTRDELRGLMASKLTSTQEPNGTTALSQWLIENNDTVGRKHASELSRRFRRRAARG